MPHIDVNFSEVPDEIKPISPGQYELEVAEVPTVEPTEKGTGQNLIVNFRVSNDGEFKGRAIRDYIFLNEFGLVKAKNLIKHSGLEISSSGLDTEELLGRKVNALLTSATYKDKLTEEVRQTTRVSRYVPA